MQTNQKGSAMLWLVIGTILVVSLAVAGYFYMQRPTQVPEGSQSQQAMEEEVNLGEEIEEVDVQGVDTEFSAVDKDLQSL